MADFVAVLRKTIGTLGENSPEMREKVFEKARATIEAKLAAMDPLPPEATTPAEELEVVECSELEGPVNLALQAVGCTVDGAPAPVSSLACDDGRTVLIAGNRYGIQGETWQPYDLGTGPPATELC